jgi:hypothetical protein
MTNRKRKADDIQELCFENNNDLVNLIANVGYP